MSVVTVSPKYQVVIPKEIRESLGLKPGQKLIALSFEGRIVLSPLRSAAELQGFLPGLDTTVPREDDRV